MEKYLLTLILSSYQKNFDEGELQRDSVVANFATTAADQKKYQVDYYNLVVIISVGYRVKSLRAFEIFDQVKKSCIGLF